MRQYELRVPELAEMYDSLRMLSMTWSIMPCSSSVKLFLLLVYLLTFWNIHLANPVSACCSDGVLRSCPRKVHWLFGSFVRFIIYFSIFLGSCRMRAPSIPGTLRLVGVPLIASKNCDSVPLVNFIPVLELRNPLKPQVLLFGRSLRHK